MEEKCIISFCAQSILFSKRNHRDRREENIKVGSNLGALSQYYGLDNIISDITDLNHLLLHSYKFIMFHSHDLVNFVKVEMLAYRIKCAPSR